MYSTPDPDKRKLLSLLSHGSVFLSTLVLPISIPIAILIITDDDIVKANAREAINFQITIWIWSLIIAALTFISFGLLGFVLIPIGYLIHWGMTIWALLAVIASPNEAVKYPLILHIL